MGIDIYAKWPDESDEERDAQDAAWLTNQGGKVGYLREAYHGEPYPSRYLVSEVFEGPTVAEIPAQVLRERLPETIRLAEIRARTVYDLTDPADIEDEVKQYREFVEFCEEREAQTGESPIIHGWW